MSKGTLYTSKAQANKSTGARLAWRWFVEYAKDHYPEYVVNSIRFLFDSQEWKCELVNSAGYHAWVYADRKDFG